VAGAAACAGLVFVPWAVYFALQTGYPLGTTPVSVAGLPLGKMTEEVRFFDSHNPPFNAYHLDTELQALATVFAPPWQESWEGTFSCSAASLLPMLAGAFALALGKSRGVAGWVLLSIVPVTLFNVYQPSFSVVRLSFAHLNGRFFFPLVAVLVLYAVANARPRPLSAALSLYLLVATGVHVDVHFFNGWKDVDRTIVAAAAILTGAALVRIAGRKPAALRPALAVLTAVTLVAAAYWKEADRVEFLRSRPGTDRQMYWLPALEALRENREPLCIAITAGMQPNAGTQFFYHFLGERLQNRLCYIPLTEDGHIVPQAPKYANTPLSFDAWRRRLVENKITHVIALAPESVELRWMREAPEEFRRVADGNVPIDLVWGQNWRMPREYRRVVGGFVADGSWGLFEFRPAPGQDPRTRRP
jgi:hypothetical protein